MKKLGRFLVLVFLCGLLVLLAGFLALGMYYRNNFPVNTWINGVYCTGKTIEQVGGELAARTEASDLVITDADGREWLIEARSLELYPDYTPALRAYMRKNASAMWMQNIKEPVTVNLEPTQYKWNAEKLEEQFEALGFVQEESLRGKGCSVRYDQARGYYLEDHNRQRLNSARALKCIEECLFNGEFSLDLVGKGCYEDLEDSPEDISQRALWVQLQEYFDCRLTYDMGAEQIPLDAALLSSFLPTDERGNLLTDENGGIAPDREKVERWVEDLAAQYDTCDTTREFQSSRGDVVSVEYGTYGTKLDVKAEKKYLVEALKQKRSEPEVHVPAYKQEGFTRGLDDIGNTYIEVDMTEQHMYYYADGELKLDTDVVTGDVSRRRETPEGVYYVYNKQRNRTLRGPGYATPVKYWLPVNGGVGIHDAGWRKKFGGEIYKNDGSHGCINTPMDMVAQLYDMVEVGTPVVIFY